MRGDGGGGGAAGGSASGRTGGAVQCTGSAVPGGGLRVSSAAERRGTAVRGVGGLISSLGGLSPLCGGCLLCRGPLEATGASPHLPVGFGVLHVWMQLGGRGLLRSNPQPPQPTLVGAVSGRPGGIQGYLLPLPSGCCGATILWRAT